MPTPSFVRVAHRHLQRQAGGSGFEDYGKGTNARQVFNALVEEARYQSGSGGYSGTIAEKNGFELRRREPMSMSEAREFSYKDGDRNDKWGPAFAVPVATSRVLAEKEYTVKIQAKNAQEAAELGKAVIKAKGRARKGATVEVTIPHRGVVMARAGGTPTTETVKQTKTYFTVNGRGEYGSKREAALEIKAKLTGSDEWARKVGTTYLIAQVKQIALTKVTGAAERVPTWTVTGTRKQVALGKVEGYLFYGIASS